MPLKFENLDVELRYLVEKKLQNYNQNMHIFQRIDEFKEKEFQLKQFLKNLDVYEKEFAEIPNVTEEINEVLDLKKINLN